jgi:hypothetical protein
MGAAEAVLSDSTRALLAETSKLHQHQGRGSDGSERRESCLSICLSAGLRLSLRLRLRLRLILKLTLRLSNFTYPSNLSVTFASDQHNRMPYSLYKIIYNLWLEV